MGKTKYDVSNEFNEECLSLIAQLKQWCAKNNVPFFMTFAVSNGENFTDYKTFKQFPPEVFVDLHEDKFRKIALAENGFELAMNCIDQDVFGDVLEAVETPVKDEDLF